jgi:hypothetical protein
MKEYKQLSTENGENTLLKRVIERYLRASNEREYGIPFCQLLWSMGYELLESHPVHHPFEFGKDVRAIHTGKSPRVWLFQTKSGDISQSDWSEMERQLKLMLVMPVNHPNIQPDEQVQAVWVCTGDLATTVSPIMAQFNEEYQKQGHLPVKVWNMNTLVDLFEAQFFDINICPEEVVLDLINLLSGFSDSDCDLSKFGNILENVLNESMALNSARKIKQIFTTIEVFAYYLVGRGYDVNNPYHAIEALEMAILRAWRFRNSMDFQNDFLEILQGLQTLLVNLIDDLLEDIQFLISEENGLFLRENQPADIVLYPHRTFELLGYIGLRAWLADVQGDNTTFNSCVENIEKIINNNPSSSHPIWERAQEDILITAFVLWKAGKIQLASQWIKRMADWVADIYTERGGLARPGASTKEVVKQLFGTSFSFADIEPVNTSYLCYTILELCYWFDLSDVYTTFYQCVNSIRLIDFEFETEESIYENPLVGLRNQVVPPSQWNEFKAWYHERYYSNDPTIFSGGISPQLAENYWILLIVSNHFGNRPFAFVFRREIFKPLHGSV